MKLDVFAFIFAFCLANVSHGFVPQTYAGNTDESDSKGSTREKDDDRGPILQGIVIEGALLQTRKGGTLPGLCLEGRWTGINHLNRNNFWIDFQGTLAYAGSKDGARQVRKKIKEHSYEFTTGLGPWVDDKTYVLVLVKNQYLSLENLAGLEDDIGDLPLDTFPSFGQGKRVGPKKNIKAGMTLNILGCGIGKLFKPGQEARVYVGAFAGLGYHSSSQEYQQDFEAIEETEEGRTEKGWPFVQRYEGIKVGIGAKALLALGNGKRMDDFSNLEMELEAVKYSGTFLASAELRASLKKWLQLGGEITLYDFDEISFASGKITFGFKILD